jgi:hypothetical protein
VVIACGDFREVLAFTGIVLRRVFSGEKKDVGGKGAALEHVLAAGDILVPGRHVGPDGVGSVNVGAPGTHGHSGVDTTDPRLMRESVVDDSVDIEAAAYWLEQVPKLVKWSQPDDQITFDCVQQSNWHMPDQYKTLDIAEHVLSLCSSDAELQRVAEELLLYQQHDLFDLLRYLKYLVDVMKQNNVIWGVGRGSSVASHVLYLLRVHRINALYYELDPAEFLR